MPSKVRDLAVTGGPNLGVQIQLLGNVGDPAGAEALPCEHCDRARTDQRPDGHLHRSGVGSRDDSKPVARRKLEQRVGAFDSFLQSRLAK
jgi:hypothetical protein